MTINSPEQPRTRGAKQLKRYAVDVTFYVWAPDPDYAIALVGDAVRWSAYDVGNASGWIDHSVDNPVVGEARDQ